MIQSKKFQIGWSVWIFFLGLSLLFFYTLQNVHSFSEYLNAFITFDMPSSWCPTFLILYGLTTFLSQIFHRGLIPLSRLTGLILLPIGLYATYEYTFFSHSDPLSIYVYAQTIHLSEILTGGLTLFLLLKWNEINR